MIIKFRKKQEEKFPEWKAVVPKSGKLIETVDNKTAETVKNDNDLYVMSIEEAAYLKDKYFVKYDYMPKELIEHIKSLVDYEI